MHGRVVSYMCLFPTDGRVCWFTLLFLLGGLAAASARKGLRAGQCVLDGGVERLSWVMRREVTVPRTCVLVCSSGV